MDKENFCMAPWVHMSVWQTGDAYPCCIYDWTKSVGNINKDGFAGVWNSDDMKALRLRMLNDQVSEGCAKCNYYDKQGILSYRYKFNNEYNHHYDLVEQTNSDGSVDKLNIAYFDVRFSNLCNMKCRTCGPHFSSKWAEDTEGKPKIVEINHPEMWTEIETMLDSIEEIYFTGGESMFMEQHYRLLDMLIQKGQKPKLTYNSNASRLALGGKRIDNYWKHFDNIFYGVSLDQIGPKAEYTRHGQPWKTVFDNLLYIRDNFDQVTIQPNPTVNVLNILDLREIMLFLFDNDLATDFDINLSNILVGPTWLSITILPDELKQRAKKSLEQLKIDLDQYTMYNERKQFLIDGIDSIINYLFSRNDQNLINEFKVEMQKTDKIRNENFVEVFPELAVLYE
jgi:radical SAM protein with 4Fe4S-binding SPASM domain